jgi:hypothetical protein
LTYFIDCLPKVAPWGIFLAALGGAVFALRFRNGNAGGVFWFSWALGYAAFKLLIRSSSEPRYLIFALPALPGLAACLFGAGVPAPLRRWLAPALIGAGLVSNALRDIERGVVGYDAIAQRLAVEDKPGNVLLACWEDQEFIFRYRCQTPPVQRLMVRSDRSLTIRIWDYALLNPDKCAQSQDNVLDIICRGRVRFLVTYSHIDSPDHHLPKEMALVHDTARSVPGGFRLLGRFPLLIQYYNQSGRQGQVFLWEYLGELPASPSELPVPIPTADLVLGAKG